MRTSVLAMGVAVVFAATAAADDKTPLEGKWTINSLTRDGKADDGMKGATRVHEADKYIITPPKDSKAPTTEGTFTVDAAKKTIDMKPSSGNFKGKTLLGVYKLDGDTLTIAFHESERPTGFESKEGSKVVVAVMKKAK
ncbi:MAG: TIGR03067 domain-containing protein [Fimbriiglobus sp.]|jgi:uncharacterized protein (TIGR03067 family)|nr:TIGR03067 domain-containing protein [Fimbriiglobus sp.]